MKLKHFYYILIPFAACITLLFACLMSFIVWISIEPQSLPSVTEYIESYAKDVIPETATLKIKDFQIVFNQEHFQILFKIKDLHFDDSDMGNIDIPEIHLSLLLKGLISDAPLYHLHLVSPHFDLKKQVEDNPLDPHFLKKWNNYLETHKKKISKFKISSDNIKYQLDIFGNTKIFLIKTFSLIPVIEESHTHIQTKAGVVFENKKQDIEMDSYFKEDSILTKFNLILAENVNIEGQSELLSKEGVHSHTLSFSAKNLPVSKVVDYWPSDLKKNVREWIATHIPSGLIYSANGTLHLADLNAKPLLRKDDLQIVIYFTNLSLNYMSSVPRIENMEGSLHISDHDLSFEVQKAQLSKTYINNATGSIDFDEVHTKIPILGQAEGPVQDAIDLAFAHADLKNTDLKNINGVAQTDIQLTIPLDEEITFPSLKIRAHSVLHDVSAKTIYKHYGLDKGTLHVNLKDSLLRIQGPAQVNGHIPIVIDYSFDFEKKETLTFLKGATDWKDLEHVGMGPFDTFEKSFGFEIFVTEHEGKEKTIVELDLKNSDFHYKILSKKAGVPANFKVEMEGKEYNTVHFKYSTDLGILKSTGTGKMFKDFSKILELNSSMTKIVKSSDLIGELSFSYKEPELILMTDNAGNVLKALDLTEKIDYGDLKFEGTLQENLLKGNLLMEDFDVQNNPFMLKIFSIQSLTISPFQSLKMILLDQGLPFSILNSSFSFQNNEILIERLFADGDILKVDLKGKVQVKENTTDLSGVMVPQNLVNTVVNNVPLLNKKISDPISVNVKIHGSLSDPEVSSTLFR